MLVFWEQNLVILSVPKTGSTALDHALGPRASMILRDPPQLKHAPVYRYSRFLQPFFVQAGGQRPELLGVIRQPVDWLGSWFRYRGRDDLAGHPNSTKGVSFDDFVLEYCKGSPAPFAAVGSQARFLGDGKGSCEVDHLFRYEAQEALLAFLSDRLGFAIDLPRMNVSPPGQPVLSPDVEARLRGKRPAEFALWEAARA